MWREPYVLNERGEEVLLVASPCEFRIEAKGDVEFGRGVREVIA
jgi:hypothetical protein